MPYNVGVKSQRACALSNLDDELDFDLLPFEASHLSATDSRRPET